MSEVEWGLFEVSTSLLPTAHWIYQSRSKVYERTYDTLAHNQCAKFNVASQQPSQKRSDQDFHPTHISFLCRKFEKSAPVTRWFQAAWLNRFKWLQLLLKWLKWRFSNTILSIATCLKSDLKALEYILHRKMDDSESETTSTIALYHQSLLA